MVILVKYIILKKIKLSVNAPLKYYQVIFIEPPLIKKHAFSKIVNRNKFRGVSNYAIDGKNGGLKISRIKMETDPRGKVR